MKTVIEFSNILFENFTNLLILIWDKEIFCLLQLFLSRVLPDSNGYKTQHQSNRDPSQRCQNPQVHVGSFNTPAAGKYIPQRLDGVRLRQEIDHVA